MRKVHILYGVIIAVLLVTNLITALALGSLAATDAQLAKFDLNGDGAITIEDVSMLLNTLCELGVKEGIVAENGGVRFYRNNEPVTGFYTLDGKKLYFDPETGLMQTGEITVDGFHYAAPTPFTNDGLTLYAYGNPTVTDGLEYEYNADEDAYTVKGIGAVTGSSVVIPKTYNGKPVTAIADKAFADQTQMTAISIPEGIKTIGTRAFYNTGITEITIPASVTSIGTQIFYKANDLKTVYYYASYAPNGTTNQFLNNASIEKIVFGNIVPSSAAEYMGFQNNVKTIEIADNVTSIGWQAFSGCTGLTSVTIGNGVTSIDSWAFWACTGLTSVTIPNSVTSIGDSAFYLCTGLTSVTIPDSVTSIDWQVFSGCTGLTSVTIPDSVTSISRYAFEGCTSLTSVTIPDSVTSIGEGAFCDCTGLTSVTIPDSVTSIGSSAFHNCTGLTSVTIPDSVTSIGGAVFYNCTGLTSVTIPDSVTSIGGAVFYNCTGLTSVTIPDSVTSIGEGAFCGCSSLTTVYYRGTAAQWSQISIGSENGPLYNATKVYNYQG